MKWTGAVAASGYSLFVGLNQQVVISTAGVDKPNLYAGTSSPSSLGLGTTTPRIVSAILNSTSSYLRIDGVADIGPSNIGTNSITNLTLMDGDGLETYHADGDLYEFIAYRRALALTEEMQIEDYLNVKYALGLDIPSLALSPALAGRQCVVGALQGICIAPTSILGDGTYGRHMQTGVREETTEGYPSPPCLALDYPGFWRFRLQVVPGIQTISIWAKQVSNVTGKRPSMVVKANAAIGVATDLSASAGSSSGWTKIGPITITASDAGVCWVELHNNDSDTFYSTAYFDAISS